MPIKAGDLIASAFGQLSTTLSDGKRMRILWEPGNGDGESSLSIVERTLTTVKGHPTWKLFCGNVADPLLRGTNEPPHYVYLDDRACYAIWISQQYTKHELKTFWPFDFDHAGRLRTRRQNRGRPAYLNDSCLKYAKGTLRDKTKTYEFCGAPEYALARIGKSKNAQPHVKIELGSEHIQSGVARVTKSIGRSTTPRVSANKAHLANHNGRLGIARTPWGSPSSPRSYISGPTDGSVIPMGLARNAVQGSPYFEQPAAAFRANPRPRAGDLAGVKGKGVDEEEMDGKEILLSSKVIRKRVMRKRIKIEEGLVVAKGVEPKPVKGEGKGKGCVVVLEDGDFDDDDDDDDDDDVVVVPEGKLEMK